jgi:hypothetical protein
VLPGETLFLTYKNWNNFAIAKLVCELSPSSKVRLAVVFNGAVEDAPPFCARVIVLGAVPRHSMAPLFYAADAFVSPAVFENFGMITFEAALAQCPLLLSIGNRGALEVLTPGRDVLVFDHVDSLMLSALMELLSGNEALRVSLGKRAKATAQREVERSFVGLSELLDLPKRPLTYAPITIENWRRVGKGPLQIAELGRVSIEGRLIFLNGYYAASPGKFEENRAVFNCNGSSPAVAYRSGKNLDDGSFCELFEQATLLRPHDSGGTHAATPVVGHEVYVLAGQIGTGCNVATNSSYALDVRTGSWRPLPPLPPLYGCQAQALSSGEILLFGGDAVDRRSLSFAAYRLPLNAPAWIESPALRVPRDHFGSAVVDDIVYAVGGNTGHHKRALRNFCESPENEQPLYICTDSVQSFDLSLPFTAQDWRVRASLPVPVGHNDNLLVVYKNRWLLLAGGHGPRGDFVSGAVQAYDTWAGKWYRLNGLPLPMFKGAACWEHDDVLCCYGGQAARSIGNLAVAAPSDDIYCAAVRLL